MPFRMANVLIYIGPFSVLFVCVFFFLILGAFRIRYYSHLFSNAICMRVCVIVMTMGRAVNVCTFKLKMCRFFLCHFGWLFWWFVSHTQCDSEWALHRRLNRNIYEVLQRGGAGNQPTHFCQMVCQ